MSFFDDMLAGADKLNLPQPTEKRAFRADKFDDMDWDVLNDDVPMIDDIRDGLSNDFGYIDEMMQDLFQGMHKARPELRDPEEMDERYRPNQHLLNELSQTEEWQRLREHTVGDKYNTAAAMMALEDDLREALEGMREAREAAEQAQQQRDQAAADAQAAQDAIQQAGQLDPNTPAGQAALAAAQAALDAAQQSQQAAMDASAAANQLAQTAAQATTGRIQSAVDQVANQRKQEDDLVAGFGMDPGEVKRMDFNERRQLGEAMRNSRLANFADLIGQLKQFARAKRRKRVPDEPEKVIGVELGNDLTRLVGAEWEALAHPLLRIQFLQRHVEHEQVQFKREGTEHLGRGPIIVVCDESGSMAADGGGGWTREAWSKALTLSLMESARREQRDFTYIGFGSAHEQYRVDFPAGKVDIPKMMLFVEHFFSGGTHYEKPLVMARTIVEEAAAQNRNKPDIVFITDEEYRVMSDDWMRKWDEVRDATDMQVYGILISTRPARETGAITQISNEVRTLDDLTDHEKVGDLFFKI